MKKQKTFEEDTEAWSYLSANKTIGFETFSLITRLNDQLEAESIRLFFEIIEANKKEVDG